MPNKTIINLIDKEREAKGFLKVAALMDLSLTGNVILDPFSTLIGVQVKIGSGNVFYPGVIIEASQGGIISIGNDNLFYPQTLLLAAIGAIHIGNNNFMGDGGLSMKANYRASEIIVGDGGRYTNGVQVLGRSYLGSGSQIIGGILTVQDCRLGAGEDFRHGNCDLRGGVLKGFGVARGIIVKQGMVIGGQGLFKNEDVKEQSFYHVNDRKEE